MGRSDSRERAVETAALLFQREGYGAVGLTRVIEESGTPKGSFYFNFPGGKEELGVAALALGGERLQAAIDRLAAAHPEPAAFVRALAAALAAGLEGSGYALGCPVATVALEAASTSEPLRAAASEQLASWEEAIARGLRGGGPAARPRARERRLATVVLAALEGALLLGRVHRSREPLERAGEQLAALVAAPPRRPLP